MLPSLDNVQRILRQRQPRYEHERARYADGRAIFYRTVYDGLRTNGNVLFNESRDLSVQRADD
jgi:hypothetical protein